MKLLKQLVAGAFIVMLTASFQQNQVDFTLARASTTQGKLAFFWSEPINQYDVAFTFENHIQGYDCYNPQQIIGFTISNASLESGNQNKLYDAVIIGKTGRDMAITWKDKTKDNAICRVTKTEGKMVFVDCEPLSAYTILGKYNIGDKKGHVCKTHQEKVDKLLYYGNKKLKGKFNAIMYGSSNLDLVISFN